MQSVYALPSLFSCNDPQFLCSLPWRVLFVITEGGVVVASGRGQAGDAGRLWVLISDWARGEARHVRQCVCALGKVGDGEGGGRGGNGD